MSDVGQRELLTQNHIVKFFQTVLGYRYLDNRKDRADNRNIEPDLLSSWLSAQGHSDQVITKAIYQLQQAATVGGAVSLYDANREAYDRLRYGVKVLPEMGEQYQTVWLIDWEHPERNDFAFAEEVTVIGPNVKRPDIVIYVNGIALAVLELKRSIVSVTEGIRQQIASQKKEFIRSFFSTVQFVMAGNDTEGLRYGVIETPEKYFLSWSEPEDDSGLPNKLDRALWQLCRKERFLELTHEFILFDAGIKKTCRHNQYFGIRAAQEYAERHDGGIIWHTQGSGKSLTMVWLARWIREHIENGRVLLVTDRKELDDQIKDVFRGAGQALHRATSGADLVAKLNSNDERLISSLVHKFGAQDEDGDVDQYLREITKHLPHDFRAKGDIFVFIDECHRTQSGKLHDAMKAILPNATFIGFTGTPLLKRDKLKSIEVFGPYIHTYKYDEAVRDGVVLDLRYEARDIDQNITNPSKIDQWFELKTKGLTDVARAQLKQRWGTMQKVLSSQDRLERIVADILFDMETRPRLMDGRGNAMLVCGSIYSACRIYEMFQQTDLGGKCAIITSYAPSPNDIKGEDSGEGMTEKLKQYDIYRKMLADHFDEPEERAMYKVDTFEKNVKKRFIEEPGQMRLLIVVDKLLTGFDAPPATYLYIDKQMRDHALFQAICRVNRLDGEDKEYGYVIDYKDLFKSLERSIHDYTSEAFDSFDAEDVQGLLENRLEKSRERLEELREEIKALCEPVALPRQSLDYLHYFCAEDTTDVFALKNSEPRRVQLYQATASLLRAYANIANEIEKAGYSVDEIEEIKREVVHYEKVREEVKLASGDYVDMKLYEPAMRHLLDAYIRADESVLVSTFNDMTLVDLIVARGPGAVAELPTGIRSNESAVAETIENNVRKVIIDEQNVNPKYYEKMSDLLNTLIELRKQQAIDYRTYLGKISELSTKIKRPETGETYPKSLNNGARRALYDNLDKDEALALDLDEAVRNAKYDDWRGNSFKERKVKRAIRQTLEDYNAAYSADDILELVKHQHEY